MGKFIDRFKGVAANIDKKVNQGYVPKEKKNYNSRINNRESESINEDLYDGMEEDYQEEESLGEDNYEVGMQPSQKPESFHHYILENRFQDLEKSIRGYKDVYNKQTGKWETKRKELHCFTDEESEEILRTAQSLLATDIKLGFINKEVFGIKMMMLFKQLKKQFREIAEYRYGRYSHHKDGKLKNGGYAIEQSMKLQNLKIFIELTEKINANYSRSIQGIENRLTHQSVKGQESLQSSESHSINDRYT